MLDFRVQVIQARRGVWQFNKKKVLPFAAMTYIGTQVRPPTESCTSFAELCKLHA